MKWDSALTRQLAWPSDISNRAEKEEVAQRLAARVRDRDVVGMGSGSTSFLAIQAIARRVHAEGLSITAIPTSAETELACAALNLPTTSLQAARPDWAFDGADEVDPNGNLIKGRGGALLREKILLASAPSICIIVDKSKLVRALGEKFPVPVEVIPDAVHLVEQRLLKLGAAEVQVRLAKGKDGPVVTERANLLLDARFHEVPAQLERDINAIPGVVENGLFIGFDPEVLVAGSPTPFRVPQRR